MSPEEGRKPAVPNPSADDGLELDEGLEMPPPAPALVDVTSAALVVAAAAMDLDGTAF